MASQTDPEYWAHYTALQKAKHELLRRYLGGWFPILASFSGLVLYVDCHAGRGRHDTGDPGSPLVALTTLLNHRAKERILSQCQVRFIFLEQNPTHAHSLQIEVDNLKPLPQNIEIQTVNADFERALQAPLDHFEQAGRSMAPSFFFFDPYGFALPMSLLQRIAKHPQSELLITFMVRYVDMAIANPSQESNMDTLFGTEEWRKLRALKNPSERQEEMIRLFTRSLGCPHSSVLEMRGEHREHKYSLIHATNHQKGRELMKSAIWSLTPEGSFAIYQSHDPRQLALITPEPNLSPLREALLRTFKGRELYYNELKDWVLDLNWTYPHLNKVIRNLRDTGQIEASEYHGRFAFDKNPVLKVQSKE